MEHPNCEYTDTRVIESRFDGRRMRRRRECLHCRLRFTTFEVMRDEFEVLTGPRTDQQRTMNHEHRTMTLETYLAVGELVQAAAHAQGLTGPIPFTVCSDRKYAWCDLDDDYVEETEEDEK